MRRLRGSAGQTTAEWLGVCVAVLALAGFTATAMPSVAGAMGGAAQRAVCLVGGGSCGGAGGRPAPGTRKSALDPSAPNSGPAIGPGSRAVGLPFPGAGSISVTVDASHEGGPANAKPEEGAPPDPSAKAGYKLGVSAKFERSTSPCSIDGTGTPTVTLSTTADIKAEAGVNGEKGGVGAGITGSLGRSTTYSVKTDPATADRITSHAVAPPNPADPRSVPAGSSILLNRDSYKGYDASATYHHITAELGYKDGHRVSSAVQRLDADHVRVTVGDSDFVENVLGLKVGTDDVAVGISMGNGFAEGKARSVDIDVGTEAGWEAYQRFIAKGILPAQDAPGTSNPTTSTSATETSTSSITGKLGPLGGTKGGTTVQGQIVETVRPDGSKTTTGFSRRGDTVIAATYDRDPSGKIVDSHYALHLQDTDRHLIDGYNQLTGGHLEDSSNRDLAFAYSESDLDNLRDQALDQILASQRGVNGSPFEDGGTRAQLRAYLNDHPMGDGLFPSAGPMAQISIIDMARAKEPADVLVALQNSGLGSSSGSLEFLLTLGLQTRRARDILGIPPDSGGNPIVGSVQSRPKGC
jgi:hypothetical protein